MAFVGRFIVIHTATATTTTTTITIFIIIILFGQLEMGRATLRGPRLHALRNRGRWRRETRNKTR